ncbi:Transcriptional corepressor LEUNIG [Dichanthelium oligosanthes]|uniref:Transcriptional corepressor LEUNIG n=1 Tax=Dichanthelium oligosanthes TaxID=888268 RepID=A0A1E5VC50_9POAL|nr:Transcriptional corepressor LEUNIG [Dichanthelium oligosanthes]
MPLRLATSSFDKTLRVWDAEDTEYSLRTFTGHQASIMSLDFHPNKQDVICSCDSDGQVRSWSTDYANCLACVKVSKGVAVQLRFQPRKGKYLAAASEKAVFILDGETQIARRSLQSLEIWNIMENKSIRINNAHDGLVAALAASSETGHIASRSALCSSMVPDQHTCEAATLPFHLG